MTTKEFTVRDAYKALAKNGFDHLRGSWSAQDFEGAITGGCVLMQSALNLGVQHAGEPYSLETQLNHYRIDRKSKWAKNPHNDTIFDGHLLGLGSVIITWNDAVTVNKRGIESWILPTYKSVVKMAKEVMEPFFDEPIELELREWMFKLPV